MIHVPPNLKWKLLEQTLQRTILEKHMVARIFVKRICIQIYSFHNEQHTNLGYLGMHNATYGANIHEIALKHL